MSYKIYTLPTCEHCHAAINLMKQKNIPFEQIDTGSPEGIKRFREFYAKYKDKIKRDCCSCTILPVIINQEDKEVIIHQGTDGLEKFLGI